MVLLSSFSALVLLIFLLSAEAINHPNNTAVISLGSQLSPRLSSSSWLSSSGHFAFGFYPRGSGYAIGIWLVGHPDSTRVVWTANRDDPPVPSNAVIEFARNGQLLLRIKQGEENITGGILPADSAAMLDSGNFVLYRNGSVVWQSFDSPTDTILGGQNLTRGMELVSSVSILDHSSGKFSLEMQDDGNLVAYPYHSLKLPHDSYWSSNTLGYGNLSLTGTGSLYLRDDPDSVVFAESSYLCEINRTIYRATLDADGIFRLYSHCFNGNTSSIIWKEWSALDSECEVHGFCGFNSYCSRRVGTNDANCICFPGFDFVDPNDKSAGCYRNSSTDSCTISKEFAQMYDIVAVENISWEDNCYSVLRKNRENCRLSCLDDCRCDAALYLNDTCKLYTIPVQYGRVNHNLSSTGFVKIIKAHPTPIPLAPIRPLIVVDNKKSLILGIAASLGSIACLSLLLAVITFFVHRHRAYQYKRLSGMASLAGDLTLQSFSYDDLDKATNSFNEELGTGSIGTVYKGNLVAENRPVAVKRLEDVANEAWLKDFQAEITVIGQTHHRNLVRLLGFCTEGCKKLLVYEYMRNGSLADLLFKTETRPIWKKRMRIALDIARGIHYLHEECEAQIIHCNISTRNILLDESWIAKISDFGIANLLRPHQHIRSNNNGEHVQASKWQNDALSSTKADIYSYGVVLLEIICCRSSIEVNVPTADEIILSSWAYKCFAEGKLEKLVEGEDVDRKALERMVKVGLWCVQDDPDLRPCMKKVILMLEGMVDIAVPPSPAVSL